MGVSIRIHVASPFWQTGWFNVLLVVLVIGGIFGGVYCQIQVAERTRELKEAKEEAEVANQAKSMFLANMSHELRTPLNAVLGYSEILSSQEKDPQKKYYLDSVQASGKSLLSLINGVRDLSRIEAGKLELQYSAVSIGQKISQYGGAGLGLAISRNIVRQMNGSLAVESTPGQGTAFSMKLGEVEVAAGAAVFNQAKTAIDPETLSFEAATVLIADDIDYNREMLAAYLRPWAFTVIFAANGIETIVQTETYHPDVILLDLKMPNMDGYEASKKIKSRETSKNIPIIAVTASVLKQDEDMIRHDSYLRKPVSQTALIKEMMKFLAHSEKKKQRPPIDSRVDRVLPNADELNALYEIALDGNMDKIVAYLEKLETQDTQLELFCQQVRELALGYQDEKIARGKIVKQNEHEHRKILVVDDEPDNLGVISGYLQDAGYQCSIASNGNTAIERAARIKPGVILLDVKMPGMDGFEVCRRLKQIESTRDIPVIFLTVLDDIESKRLGFGAGGVDYIAKPVRKEELLARVGTHLENYLYKNTLEQAVERRTAELEHANKKLSEEIDRRKASVEKLKETELRYRTVADFTYDWEYWIDPAGNYVYVSPSCERITGYCADEFIRNPDLLRSIIHPDDWSVFADHTHTVIETGARLPIDFRIVTRSGEERWIGHVCQPIHSDDERYLGQRGSNSDITKRKQAEDERAVHLHFLENMERVNQVIQKTTDIEQMMSDVLHVSLEIFESDRAGLFYPCDPDAESWSVPMECTRPEYPSELPHWRRDSYDS